MSQERLASLVAVLNAIRHSDGVTQPELVNEVRLGRSVVAQRVSELEELGLVSTGGLAPSTGGRAPRRLQLRADAGIVVSVDIAARELLVATADLSGAIIDVSGEPIDVVDAPETVLAAAERHIDKLLDGNDSPLLGIGVAIPGPVEFKTGLPVMPPIMPAWNRWPLRDQLSQRYGVPTWVDNDVNVLTLGELRANPDAKSAGNVVFMFVDVGIGAGIAVAGQIYRGANGSAGDIGHVAIPEGGNAICRCGNIGCLEAVAGAAALEREGQVLAQTRQSAALAKILDETGAVRALDITIAAEAGDPTARAMLQRSATLVGGTLATLVSFFNPNLVIIGGGIARARDFVVNGIREGVFRRSLPLSTQDLRIEMSALGERGGIIGAAHLVLDEIFTVDHVERLVEAAGGRQ
ncbi:ROK family transcriptional regulator [Nocardioides hankookensis]|uniref:ROK family transcriptional regulator n=1 Tax=Nocardioides hankookensis TaxID=443157 RepID=A0ABW1LSR5_9ACTN